MKNHETKRGYVPGDTKEFNLENQSLLLKAQKDIFYLLEQGYPMKSASTFVGNHYLLSERQRLALARATTAGETVSIRKNKQITGKCTGWINLAAEIIKDSIKNAYIYDFSMK